MDCHDPILEGDFQRGEFLFGLRPPPFCQQHLQFRVFPLLLAVPDRIIVSPIREYGIPSSGFRVWV